MSIPITPVAFTAFLALFAIVARRYVVPEGHIVPVRSGGGHRRLIWPGVNVLGPGEEAGEPIDTRPHEVVLDVPDVILHNGLPVTVKLRYMLRLLPKEMDTAALYWTTAQRENLQIQILRDSLQNAIAEMPRPVVQECPDRISLEMVFSPVVGAAFDAVCRKAHERGRKQLAEHAMHMLVKTLVIESASLPPALVDAYHDLSRGDFGEAAGYTFMQRLQNTARAMTDSCVLRLYSAAASDVPGVRDILHEGKFSSPAFAGVAHLLTKVPAMHTPARARPTPAAPIDPGATNPQSTVATEQEYPLTPEVMALLKPL